MSAILNEDNTGEIKDLLIGRRIVEATEHFPERVGRWVQPSGRLTLDDGTRIYVTPNEGCGGCTAGNYSLEDLAATPNIITKVEVSTELREGESEWCTDSKSYRIYVWAENKKITALQVDGDDGNGYYGTGFRLTVIAPGATS